CRSRRAGSDDADLPRPRKAASGQLGVELSAGGLDLPPARVAERDGYAGSAECRPKCAYALGRRAAPPRPGGRVERNEVDVAQPAVRQPGEPLSEFSRVVQSRDHDVLEADSSAGSPSEASPGAQNVGDRPFAVDRDKLVAQLIVGGVQADSEVDLRQLIDHAVHPGYNPGGADRDVPGTDPEPVGVVEEADCGEHGGDVVQRFPHAHEHDVVVARWRARPPVHAQREPWRTVPVEHLVDDLAWRQLSTEPGLARGAERTADRAAGLTRYADRRASAAPGPGRSSHQH